MDAQQIVERIEAMFDAQMDGSEFCDALNALQVDLIGEEALAEYRARKFKAYQDAHPWLYPEIYGTVARPQGQPQILTTREITETALKILNDSIKRPPRFV